LKDDFVLRKVEESKESKDTPTPFIKKGQLSIKLRLKGVGLSVLDE
jgi:hypothetical protein